MFMTISNWLYFRFIVDRVGIILSLCISSLESK